MRKEEQRLIDANALMARLVRKKAGPANRRYTEGYNDALLVCRSMIHSEKTVDAVPVMRCSWCKHWKKDVAGCTENVGRCEYANYFVGASGYCVYGERKEGADNG